LLDAQQYTCGMCHDPFEAGQLIHVDHDHACCQRKNRSCGKCVRGLLCHACNIALGYIERRYAMARAYLDSLPSGSSTPPAFNAECPASQGSGKSQTAHRGIATTETVYRKVIVPELRRGAEVMNRLFT
jgi:hypothetical protein